MKSPMPLLRSLLIDFGRLEPHVKGLDRDFRTIQRRFKREGYGFLTIALPAFCDSFDRSLSEGKFSCPLGFRKSKGSSLPRFLLGLTSEVFEPSTGLVKENPSIGCITSVRQLGRLFKKVQLDDEDSDKLHSSAVATFFNTDDLIAHHIAMDERDENLYCSVAEIVLPKLREDFWKLEQEQDFFAHADGKTPKLHFRHGPGSVAEGFAPNQKWKGVFRGILTDAFDTASFRYDLFALMSRLDLSANLDVRRNEPELADFDEPFLGFEKEVPQVASSSEARLVTVAKNSTSRRTITIEPCMNMFVQQGLNGILRDSIKECAIMRLSLDLSDQSLNQKLALAGSHDQLWSTLDLKSASDLLSVKMVERTFSHAPEFFGALMECRSRWVNDPKFGTYELSKYAGMGNATTFPVQSIVFALLAITAIVDGQARKPTYWSVKRAARHVRVFGDDIIVSTQHVHAVVSWLLKAGLMVNTKKSFLDGKFKESCGVDAYDGNDVTPLYLRQRPDDASLDANAIAGLVSFSNNAWMRGLYETSARIREEVEERLGFALPLVSSSSSALGWHSRIDAMNPTSWDSKLQRFVTKALVLTSTKRKDKLDGWPALLKFFHVPLIGRPPKHLEQSSRRFQLRISKKRVPTEVG